MNFETRVNDDDQPISAGCILPDHISYGKFSIFGTPYYVVNQSVPSSSMLTLNCDNGTRIDFYCINNEWFNFSGTKCRKPGNFF